MSKSTLAEMIADIESRMESVKASESSGQRNGSVNEVELELFASCLRDLRVFIKNYSFDSEDEEIYFFKVTKPEFLSRYYFQKQIHAFVLHEPIDSREFDSYCHKAIAELEAVIDSDVAFAEYVARKDTHFDGVYFRRGFLSRTDFETDPEFSTHYDDKAARILAAAMMKNYIAGRLQQSGMNESESHLKWTGSKADMIELIYGLETVGVVNKGAADIKEIASKFEKIFNVNLGNLYRQFLDIRLRKKDKTSFLSQMQERLEERMNDFG